MKSLLQGLKPQRTRMSFAAAQTSASWNQKTSNSVQEVQIIPWKVCRRTLNHPGD